MAITVGSGLTPVRSSGIRRQIEEKLNMMGQGKLGKEVTGTRFFTSTVAIVESTTTLSPGKDGCFVWDIENDDVYLVHHWTAANAFTSTKIDG